MASFNHHPYLSEVLTSLQKHQLALEASSAVVRMDGDEQNRGAQTFVELPWKNGTAAEWEQTQTNTNNNNNNLNAQKKLTGPSSSSSSTDPSFLHRMGATLDASFSALDPTDTFLVDGASPSQWEEDSPELKEALRRAGELPPEEELALPGNGKAITGPRMPSKNNERGTCNINRLFTF